MSDLGKCYKALAVPGEEQALEERIKNAKPLHNTLTIPFAWNPKFFSREKELAEVDDFFKKQNSSDKVPAVVIWGDEGVGQTHLALEYAWRKAPNYDFVLWVSAKSELSIQKSLSYAATKALGLTDADPILNNMLNAVLVMKWLETTDLKWLLIYDNVEDAIALDRYWPFHKHGSVLVTTTIRKSEFKDYPDNHWIGLEGFDYMDGATDGTEFLIQCLLPNRKISETDTAEKILYKLCGNPQLISQVAAFILAKGLSLEQYLDLYEKNYSSYRYPVWAISFNEGLKPGAKTVLNSLSFLMTESIPQELISSDFPGQHDGENPNYDALGALAQLALIKINYENKSISLSRDVQKSCISQMRRESRDHYQEYFRGIISHLLHYFLPKEECKSKAHVHLEPELYLPHVLEVLQHFKDDEERTSSQNLLLLIDRTLRYLAENDSAENFSPVLHAGDLAFEAHAIQKREPRLYFRFLAHKGYHQLRDGDFKNSKCTTLNAFHIISEEIESIGINQMRAKAAELNFGQDQVAIMACHGGIAASSAGDYTDGARWFDIAQKLLFDDMRQYGPYGPCRTTILIMTQVMVAQNLYCCNDFENAAKRLEEALKFVDQETELPPIVPYSIHFAYSSLGVRSKNLYLADKHLSLAIEAIKGAGMNRHLKSQGGYFYIAGRVRLNQGLIPESIDFLKKAVDIDEVINAPDNHRARTLYALSCAYAASPRTEWLSNKTKDLAVDCAGDRKLKLGSWEAFDKLVSLDFR